MMAKKTMFEFDNNINQPAEDVMIKCTNENNQIRKSCLIYEEHNTVVGHASISTCRTALSNLFFTSAEETYYKAIERLANEKIKVGIYGNHISKPTLFKKCMHTRLIFFNDQLSPEHVSLVLKEADKRHLTLNNLA